MASSILLARQPIFDKDLNTIAYELLYRDAEGSGPGIPFNGTQATAEVLLHAYSSILQNGKVKTLPAFINFNADWLYNGNLPALKPEALVLEVLEDVSLTDDILQRMRLITDAGYRLALDDFIYDESWNPALQLAKIVKIDIQQLSPAQLIRHIGELKKHNVTLLAEKVETHQEFEYCKSLGFKLFQGYFFCHPQLVEGRKLTANDATMILLLAELDNPDASPESLQEIISRDPELVLRILKIVNSARFALSREISSINEAIIALGLDELKKWALLITVTQSNSNANELIREILTRARMCELSAKCYSNVNPCSAFMTGMLSGIDAMLNLELEEVMVQLPISTEIQQALLSHEGPLGQQLEEVKHYMAAEWDQLSEENIEALAAVQEESLNWVLGTMKELH
ncbi:EAL and HDOD domain-containing protein [Neptuniibacter sp.]|uniref:EAL and HDOD domain-containing protein n=1 Tax=Neptuniibacter sp. TaxID=1962643 RepID=UPI002623C81D|nr:HDOD domain-containing protein [Neptuniibacter sp.]MCP4595450.1 HDOD domain-containing protein [Neptuniibacter sp.]